jgi:hypothetical protein
MGGEKTLDHFEVYVSKDKISAALLSNLQPSARNLDLSNLPELKDGGAYYLYVNAVGKPCVRDHLSSAVSISIK